MKLRCGTCQGEYNRTLPDGMLYFHACPPLTMLQVKRGGRAIAIPLSDLQQTDVLTVLRDGKAIELAAADVARDDTRIGDTIAPRPDARNENVDVTRKGSPHPIVAEGRGASAAP
jgi:hypothetical protein